MNGNACPYGGTPRGPYLDPKKPCRPDWQALLPDCWHAHALAPHSFRVDREHEIPARRVLGLDQTGQPCYCAYDYRLLALRSDDDEELWGALSYEESLKAWRLRNGRWLVHRRLRPFGDEGDTMSSFVFSDRMPR